MNRIQTAIRSRSIANPANEMLFPGPPRPRQGSVLVTVMAVIPILFLMAAFAVNVAYIQNVRTKTQFVADNAARAANAVYVATADEAQALAAARQIAALNPVESVVIPLEASDLEFGLSERQGKDQAYTFVAANDGNSVRVTTGSFSEGSGDAIVSPLPIFGFTRGIRPRAVAAHTQTTLDVAIVVDRSGSMAYAADESSNAAVPPASAPPGWTYGDPVPPDSRWLDLREAVVGFCNELSQTSKVEQVALCGYADTSASHQTLTDDYQLVIDQLDIISNNSVAGPTNVGDGIIEGVRAASDPNHHRAWANRALVLLSDGNHNTGTGPYTAVQDAIDEEIPIYTVSFSDEADQVLMKNLADATGGTHYHATDSVQLNAAFRKIARELPSMMTQ